MRIVAPDYLPNEMDVLRARTKTTGIYETRFQMGQLSIQYVAPTTILPFFLSLSHLLSSLSLSRSSIFALFKQRG
jgi:hypothetical protein